ncbi:MAG: antibiotic biosynthesis monooxygenase [Hymenobacter sp.]|nr:antibiotic biosynthesis monooxygenase [Hymenobacter sp.]
MVTLLNAFVVPVDKEEEFLKEWKHTTQVFADKPGSGFVETHLHRNSGVGNDAFRFINIATWESAAHWEATHDEYKPGEDSIPGVEGHPAIYASIIDVYHKDKKDKK